MTHATSDGVFVDPAFEKLFQTVAARIEERETQLTQESPDGLPVTLSTEEVDRIFEEVQLKIFVYIILNILTKLTILIYVLIL